MSVKTLEVRAPDYWASAMCEHLDEEFAWTQDLIAKQLPLFIGWKVIYDASGSNPTLTRKYAFTNFDGVKLALSEITRIADEQDHHPKVEFSYNYITLLWSTHSTHGISGNDWACAAKSDMALRHIG